ncbi:MAG: addiction module antidote protein family [Rickettsiaceae bacterium]|jgi:antitoxin ParD1/3/4|nr:addiction module antidote protein family [Rickettsiaceae bacterium]
MTSINVSLTPELISIVQHKVDSGLYNNASEVIREAIRQLDTNQELLYQLKLAHLRNALADGVKQVKNGEVTEYSLKDIISELNSEQPQ